MNQMTSWASPLPGCSPSPCFDPNALLQCYSELAAMSALVEKIVLNLLATDPTFTAAIIAAIEKSGSTLPLIGVTNGVAAQPGQVGEFYINTVVTTVNLTANVGSTLNLSAGVLQPGDWDVSGQIVPQFQFNILNWLLSPLPAGFSGDAVAGLATTSALGQPQDWTYQSGPRVQALISVPTLLNWQVTLESTTAITNATLVLITTARRMR